jgi:hypothetical protein
VMQQCANPDCRTDFRYFRGGKIYRFSSHQLTSNAPDKSIPTADQFYWLCGRCYPMLRLAMRSDGCVVLQTVPPTDGPSVVSVTVGWGAGRVA